MHYYETYPGWQNLRDSCNLYYITDVYWAEPITASAVRTETSVIGLLTPNVR